MILFLYNVALMAALTLGAPWWLWRIATARKYRNGLWSRLGKVPAHIAGKGPGAEGRTIWLHAVSVGEVLAVSRLVEEIDHAFPQCKLVISTTTETGQELARARFGSHRVFYCPLDLPWAVRAYFNAVRPCLLILAETEFWPNLLSACFRRGVPVAVVNARISDRSWPRYRKLRMFWGKFLSRLERVLAQTETDADRLRGIGCQPQRVTVAGNLKFDVRAAEETEATRLLAALSPQLKRIVAGSTLEGEEAALLAVWPRLLERESRLVLVLAPRHPQRFDAVAALLDRSGMAWVRRSDMASMMGSSVLAQAGGQSLILSGGEVVLLDTIGELASVYALASIAFVGGSLIAAGTIRWSRRSLACLW